jgi:hypothetical protein
MSKKESMEKRLQRICESIDYRSREKAMVHYNEAIQLNDMQKAWDNCNDSITMIEIIVNTGNDNDCDTEYDINKDYFALSRCLADMVETIDADKAWSIYESSIKPRIHADIIEVLQGRWSVAAAEALSDMLFLYRNATEEQSKRDIRQANIIRMYFPEHPITVRR